MLDTVYLSKVLGYQVDNQNPPISTPSDCFGTSRTASNRRLGFACSDRQARIVKADAEVIDGHEDHLFSNLASQNKSKAGNQVLYTNVDYLVSHALSSL